MTTVLVADDERHTREALARYLGRRFEVTGAEDGLQAIRLLQTRDFDLVLTDLRMPGADGMGVLDAVLAKGNRPECIVFSAYGSIESAVEAVKKGAFDFVPKPVTLSKLDEVVAAALKHRAEKAAPHDAPAPGTPGADVRRSLGPGMVLGRSHAMLKVADLIADAAPSRINIMLSGESGTGKEVAARAIHDASGRKGLFVAVHCAAITPTLLESELFGYERGAFTGAEKQRKGHFEWADGGTLLLDEIGEIDPSTQVKLLRVLEERKVVRLGGNEPIDCDVRIVSATNRNLEQMVREGKFREDLFYRLQGVSIEMPPLRERKDDIPEMTRRFIAAAARDNDRDVTGIDDDALACLVAYSWPGNIRELKNLVTRMVVLTHGKTISLANVPDNVRHPDARPLPSPGKEAGAPEPDAGGGTLGESEREHIERTLERYHGNRTHAAEALGISRRTLIRKLKQYGHRDE